MTLSFMTYKRGHMSILPLRDLSTHSSCIGELITDLPRYLGLARGEIPKA